MKRRDVKSPVNRRRNEIGVRMALGANARQVSVMVLRQGLRPVAVGIALGMAGALALGRVLEALLFEMRARDPVVLGGVVVIFLGAAALACFAPARRATMVDPAIALRYE